MGLETDDDNNGTESDNEIDSESNTAAVSETEDNT